LYKDLATEFLNQDKPFYLFWAKYKSRPYVLAKKKEEIEYLDLPLKRQKGPVLVHPHEGRRDKALKAEVKLVNDAGTVIENPNPKPKPKPKDKPSFDEAKYSLFILPFDNFLKEKKITAIPNVTKVFITPTPTSTEEEKKRLKSIIRAEDNTDTHIEKTITWYSVDERLASFLCTTNRIWIDESNSVRAILPDPDKTHIFFKIGYMSEGGTFFEQSKAQFIRERDYINKLRQTRDGEIGGILGSKISPDIEKFAIDFLSNSLSNVASGVTQYQNREKDGYNYKAIQKMIESADGKTKKLFENLAKITVFLQNPDSIFAQRIREEFYIPEILVTLTDKEKLPEIFDDPNQNIELVKDHILKQIESEVKRIATLRYKIKNSTVS